jgi:TetR/AcrR family acrAB operon transcriptional repressor
VGRKETGEQSRGKILDAALQVFAEKGYVGASIDDIAKKVGMTKGALYWHFKDKLDLYADVHFFVFDEYDKKVLKPLADIDDPREKIKQIIVRTLEFYGSNPTISSFYSTCLHEGQDTLSPRVVKRTRQAYKEFLDLTTEIISDGIKRGRFAKVDPRVSASVLLASLDGILTRRIMNREEIDLGHAAKGIMQIFFNGLEVQGKPGS